MNLKIKINDYITVSSEQNKISIYIQEERVQEFEYSFINKILKKSKSQLEKANTQDIYTENKFDKESNNAHFNNYVNIFKFWIKKKSQEKSRLFFKSIQLL